MGEMYKLFNGDCLEVMDKLIEEGVKVDAIICDPPYELENHGKGKNKFLENHGKGKNEFKNRKLVNENHIEFISNGFDYNIVFDKMLKLQNKANILIFCSNKQVSKIMSYFENKKLSTTLLVWNKTNPIPLCNGKHISDIEFIVYVRGKGAIFNNCVDMSKKYKVKRFPTTNTKNRLHPTQKPIDLLTELVELHSVEHSIVFDCFMGSGTTGVACMNTNRKFIGIELDKNYFDIAKKRIEEASK